MKQSIILFQIQRHFGCADLRPRNGKKPVNYYRQVAQFIFHRKFEFTLKETGSIFNIHYSTVIHSIKTIDGLLSYDENVQRDICQISKSLNK